MRLDFAKRAIMPSLVHPNWTYEQKVAEDLVVRDYVKHAVLNVLDLNQVDMIHHCHALVQLNEWFHAVRLSESILVNRP